MKTANDFNEPACSPSRFGAKSLLCYAAITAITALACSMFAGRADAKIFYSTHFPNNDGWSSNLDGLNIGGSIENSNPFVLEGTPQGNYMSANNYPTVLLSQPVLSSSDPDVWLSFLMRVDSGNHWAGGIGLCAGTDYNSIIYGPWNGTAGWHQATEQLTLINADYTANAPNSIAMTTNGSVAAVLAHFYSTNSGATYNTADLWVQTDLSQPLFSNISQSSALDYGFSMGPAAQNVINSIRLLADGGQEVRSYDNVVLASSSSEAVNFVSSVPEPRTKLMILPALVAAGFLLRRGRRYCLAGKPHRREKQQAGPGRKWRGKRVVFLRG